MQFSRRQFIGRAVLVGGAAVTGAALGAPVIKEFVSGLTDSPEVKPSNNEISEVEVGEYACIWNMRPAVLINNFLASERLNGLIFPKGTAVSLAHSLGLFDDNYLGFNFDSSNSDYVGDLHLSISRHPVSVIEAGGLSFTATMMARAGLSTLVNFTEFHTHTNVPSSGLLKDYFDPKRIVAPKSIREQLTRLGTDATIFVADDTIWDLRFVPLEDMIFMYKLQVLRGNGSYQDLTTEDAESSDSVIDWLTNSATKLSSMQVRALATFQPLNPPSPSYITLVNTQRDFTPGFRRDIYYNGRIYTNEFYAHYDTSGNFIG
ncbi:MAG: hypothetical protein RLY61_418 [Candidatus Parcubacteria bacterium]